MKVLSIGALIAALTLAMGVPVLAQEADEQEPAVSYHYDSETGELTFGYGVDLDCTPTDEVAEVGQLESTEVEVAEAGDETADESIAIGECTTISTAGPNDQLNHGSAMSAVVHAIKASDFDGPRGHLIREFAKSDIGKKDKSDKPGKGPKTNPGKGNGKSKKSTD